MADQQVKAQVGQVQSRSGEIPDFNEQEIPKAVMSDEVKDERNVRRYVKKDGVFCKGFVHFFDKDTGKFDAGGHIIYKPEMTEEQAQAFITEICEAAGRIVEIDSITGRPQAVPGWNLDIRVPGMRQSEEKAVTVPVVPPCNNQGRKTWYEPP